MFLKPELRWVFHNDKVIEILKLNYIYDTAVIIFKACQKFLKFKVQICNIEILKGWDKDLQDTGSCLVVSYIKVDNSWFKLYWLTFANGKNVRNSNIVILSSNVAVFCHFLSIKSPMIPFMKMLYIVFNRNMRVSFIL